MNSRSIAFAGVLLFQVFFANPAFAKVESVIGPVALKDNINLASALPTTDQTEIIISRDQYVISYNKIRHAPNWVAWKLEADQIGQSGRSNNFQADPDLEKYLSTQPEGLHAITPEDYKQSCFDRGHQVPSADRTDSEKNNETTFLMSNMIPQTAHLNRVIWEHLETYTRGLVLGQSKKLYIMAGPIYDEDFGSIGLKKDIPVPSKNFKMIIVLDKTQTLSDINESTTVIAVIMPNVLADGSKPTDHEALCKASTSMNEPVVMANDWEQYKTTVAEIEKLSGLSFSQKP